MTDALKTIKVIAFNDEKRLFKMWQKKFEAAAKSRGYRKILDGTIKVPPDSQKPSANKPEEKVLMQVRDLNEKAYSDLILSCEGEISFAIVDEAVTDDLPDGDARLAWINLEKKFMPKTSSTIVELKKMWAASQLKNARKDPDKWIQKLEIVRARLKKMNHTITDDDVLIHIVNNLPKEYDELVERLEEKIGADQDELTIDELRTKLNAKFRRLQLRSGRRKITLSDYDTDNSQTMIARR